MVSWKPLTENVSKRRAAHDGMRKMRTENLLLNLATLLTTLISCVDRDMGKSLGILFKRI